MDEESLEEASPPNYSGADLTQHDFGTIDLFGANFQDCDLRGADLSKVRNLETANVAGADLAGARVPEGCELLGVESYPNDSIKQVQTILLGLLAACAYCFLTAATTTDAKLVLNDTNTPLPIIQAAVPLVLFYTLAPAVVLLVYFYLHLCIEELRESLSTLPNRFPNGQSLYELGKPWLMGSLPWIGRRMTIGGTQPRPRAVVALLAAWWTAPITIFILWLRFLPRHDLRTSIIQIMLLAATIAIGVGSYLLAKRRSEKLPSRLGLVIPVGSVVVASTLLIFATVSVIRTRDPDLTGRVSAAADESYGGDHYASSSRLDRFVRYFSVANISGVDFSPPTKDAAPPSLRTGLPSPEDDLTTYSAPAVPGKADASTNCPQIRGAFVSGLVGPLAQGNSLRGVDLSRANARQAIFRNSNLSGATLAGANLAQSDFADADLTGADMSNARMFGVRLTRAFMMGARGRNVRFADAWGSIAGADLSLADLDHADFRGADFFRTVLVGADFINAKLDGAVFGSADIRCARFEGTEIRGADFEGVRNATPRQFAGACGDEHTKMPEGITIEYCPDVRKRLAPQLAAKARKDAAIAAEAQKTKDKAEIEHFETSGDRPSSALIVQLSQLAPQFKGRSVRVVYEPKLKSKAATVARLLRASGFAVEPRPIPDSISAENRRDLTWCVVGIANDRSVLQKLVTTLAPMASFKHVVTDNRTAPDGLAAVLWFLERNPPRKGQ